MHAWHAPNRFAATVGLSIISIAAAPWPSAAQVDGVQTARAGHDRCFSRPTAESGLQAVLDAALSQPNIVNAVMLVQSPRDDFFWTRAGGIANPDTGAPMTTAHQFRIASVTKMLTAVIVLQLVEDGRVSLDARLGQLLDASDLPPGFEVADLSVVNGVRYGHRITVRQLLNHTAGLRDYVFDSATDATTHFAPESLAAVVIADILGLSPSGISQHQWSPKELLGWYLETGLGAQGLAPPGQVYHYSDTDYVLLGLIAQRVSGHSLPRLFRQRIFAPLAMTRSYFEWYEPARGEGPVHHFLDLTPLGVPQNIDVVAAGVNTSFDWGGGGVVSTVGDLDRFLRALFGGRLFRHASTLVTMLRSVPSGPQERYGLGITETQVGRQWFLGQNGAFGAEAVIVARDGTTIVLTVNQWAFAADTGLYRNALADALRMARRGCGDPEDEDGVVP